MPHTSGIELKLLRVRNGVRQYRVAQALGIPPSLLCDYENGRRPIPPGLAARIVRALEDLAAPRSADDAAAG